MNPIAVLAVVVALGLLGSKALGRTPLSLPIVFVAAGMLIGPHALGWLDLPVDAHLTKEFAEITLGLLLFADASTLRARLVISERELEGRLLGIALPLILVAGGVAAWLLFPDEHLGLVLLIAATLAPTDAALGLPVFTNPRIPYRIRQSLNVESGLNDGIVAPLVTLFISMTIAEGRPGTDGWLTTALEEIAVAVAIGIVVGTAGGWAIRTALARGWATTESARLAFAACAALAFFSSGNWDGNRFIAAFVAGLACGSLLGDASHDVAEYTEATGSVLSYVVWVMFGALLVPLVITDGIEWRALIFAVFALTAMRMIPVALALIGSGFRRDTIALMGWFGPRGLASVVFLITGFSALERAGQPTELLVSVATWTILSSVLLHGLSAGPLGAWYGDRLAAGSSGIPEFAGETGSPAQHG